MTITYNNHNRAWVTIAVVYKSPILHRAKEACGHRHSLRLGLYRLAHVRSLHPGLGLGRGLASRPLATSKTQKCSI